MSSRTAFCILRNRPKLGLVAAWGGMQNLDCDRIAAAPPPASAILFAVFLNR
jgi:hypothetical protein